MYVRIAEKFRPFSLSPGSSCLLPGTREIVRAFPERLERNGVSRKISVPYEKFSLIQDLEKGLVRIGTVVVKATGFVPAKERLSLGSSKKLDWDQIRRRRDPSEILPVWYALSQITPPVEGKECKSWDLKTLMDYWTTGFSGIFVPELDGISDLGLPLPPKGVDLLCEGGRQIRSLFIEVKKKAIEFLPRLPKEFACGRMTGVRINDTLTVDFLWSKRRLRQVVLHPKEPQEITIFAGKGLHSFRLRHSSRGKGERFPTCYPIEITKRTLLDNFMCR